MPRKPPEIVSILGKMWSVTDGGDEETLGLCDVGNCAIVVDLAMDPQQQRDTLWHELIHAVSDTLHLDLRERQVHALAAAQYALMKENRDLMQWILGKH